MINLEPFIPSHPLSLVLLIGAMMIHIWHNKKWQYLWLLPLITLNQFIPLIEAVIILFTSFFVLPKKSRVVSSLLIIFSLLSPAEIRGFFYLALAFWQLEYFLSGPSSEKLDESLPAFIFLYFTKAYLGPQVDLVGNYLLVIVSLRMLLFVKSAHQVLLGMYLLFMALSLLSQESTHSLIAIATLGGVLLHLSDKAFKKNSFEESFRGSFYDRPQYFFSFLASWICGPLLLLSILALAAPIYAIPLFCLLLMFGYRILCLFTSARVVQEGGSPTTLSPQYVAALFLFSLTSFIVAFYHFKLTNLGSGFIIWGIALLLMALAYGVLKFFFKDDLEIDNKAKVAGIILSEFQHTFTLETTKTAPITVSSSRPSPVKSKWNIAGEEFAFPVVVFVVVVIGLIILMGEMQI